MEIKTKFNIGEKIFYTLDFNSIHTVVKSNPLFTDKEIFDQCYGDGFIVGIRASFNVNNEKPKIMYLITSTKTANDQDIEMLEYCGASYDEDLISNNREELEKKIHDIHIAELEMLNEKIMNLMK